MGLSGTKPSSNENLGSELADALMHGFRRNEQAMDKLFQSRREHIETSAESPEAKELALDELYNRQAQYLSSVNSPEALRQKAEAAEAGRRALDMLAAPRAGGGGRPGGDEPTQSGAPPTHRR